MRTPKLEPAISWPRLALAGVAGGVAGVVGYASLVEPRRLEIRRSTIHVPSLPPGLEGLRIALLSDLHSGPLTPTSLLRRAVRETLEHQPDLITLAGDIVDRHARDLAPAIDAIRQLHAPLGVYIVPGNHDHAQGDIATWHQALTREPGIHDVTNGHVLIERNHASLCVAGVDDLQKGAPTLHLPPPATRDFTILLAHNPDQAERSRRHDDAIDLVLSGHTHGGQIRIPGLGPIRRKSTIYDQGLRRRPWTQVYTSRGLGTTLLPLRFNARPELAILDLTNTPREKW